MEVKARCEIPRGLWTRDEKREGLSHEENILGVGSFARTPSNPKQIYTGPSSFFGMGEDWNEIYNIYVCFIGMG